MAVPEHAFATDPPPRRELIINGLPLANDAVGIGVYGRRLVHGLLARRADLTCSPVVIAPEWIVRRLKTKMDIDGLWSPRLGHPLIDEAIWSQQAGLWARKRGAQFFSPAPLWSIWAPDASAVFQHDRIYHFFPQYLGRGGIRKFLARRAESFLGRCRFIVTHSEHGRRDLATIPGVRGDRIRVIRPWLPDEFNPRAAARSAPRVRNTYGLPERFWLYVGGYDYRKNVELLIAAYARVSRGRHAPLLVLAGRLPPRKGPYCDVTGALGAAGVPDDKVILPGFIAAEDMPGLFGAAELMIYPSRYEGFGLPAMEAMGCGCPTVCADNTSLPEVVRDRDYRFADDDGAALGDLLARALRARLPLNPSFTREDFNERTAIDAYVTLFNEMAAS